MAMVGMVSLFAVLLFMGWAQCFYGLRKAGMASIGRRADHQSENNSQVIRRIQGTAENPSRSPGKWNELAREETPLWARGLPVMVQEARVVTQGEEGDASLVLGFQNLHSQDILSVFVSVKCYDSQMRELEGLEKLTAQGLRLAPGEQWRMKKPFPLPNQDTRRVELTVKSVVFEDGSLWTNEAEAAMAPLMAQPKLELPQELAAELYRESRSHIPGHAPEQLFRYRPQNFGDCWRCACGQMNLGGTCLTCGMEKEILFDLARPERLSEIRKARLARQRRQEEERQITGQTEAARRQAAGTGNQASSQTSKQTVKQAKTAEKKPSKRTILIAGCVCAAVLVVLGAVFGFRAYRAGQEEKARQEEEMRLQEEIRLQEEQAAQELAEWEAQFFFPYSDKEAIDESALSALSESELALAKYEIWARHGRVFSTPEYAGYFESKPWYVPDADFSENDANAFSDVEQANIDLIDQAITQKKNARAAAALLAKLDGYTGRLEAQDGITPVDGVYYGLSATEDGARKQVSMNTGGEVASIEFTGLLCAKTVDVNHDGMPELVAISLMNGDSSGICVEFWKYDGENVVPFAENVYMNLTASGGELSYLPGSDRDYFCLSARTSGEERTAQEDIYITLDERTQLLAVSSTDSEGNTAEGYSINGEETSKESYDQKKAELSQQEGTLWVDSYLNSEFWASESGLSGGLYLDGPQECADAEAVLKELANG